MAFIMPYAPDVGSTIQRRFHQLDAAIDQLIDQATLAA
jgi:hypothetical protein